MKKWKKRLSAGVAAILISAGCFAGNKVGVIAYASGSAGAAAVETGDSTPILLYLLAVTVTGGCLAVITFLKDK